MAKWEKEKCVGCGEMIQLKSDNSCPRCGTKKVHKDEEVREKAGFATSALDGFKHEPLTLEIDLQEEEVLVLSELISEADDCIVCAENRSLGRPKCLKCGKWLTLKGAV